MEQPTYIIDKYYLIRISAYVQPTSKRVTLTCTPRVCKSFDTPLILVTVTEKPKSLGAEKLWLTI